MKKLLTATALMAMIFVTTSANAKTIFEKVYTVPGASASAIEQAFGEKKMTPKQGGIEKAGNLLSLIGGNVNFSSSVSKYNITCLWLGTSHKAQADIALLTKDGKYKLVISNAINEMGFELTSGAESFTKKCMQDIADWAEMKHQKVVKAVDF
jgi:phosphotransferase system IIB component